MSFGEKLKEIRKRFGLSQNELAKTINVSRQAITKWESDIGLPDISNLQEISKVFNITVDNLLDNENHFGRMIMRKELDKKQYKNKISSYQNILKEYYDDTYEIYILSRNKNMNTLEKILDFITYGIHDDIEGISDMSPYYLVKKDNLKLLVNIKNWVLEIIELPSNTNDKKFIYNNNKFTICGQLKL